MSLNNLYVFLANSKANVSEIEAFPFGMRIAFKRSDCKMIMCAGRISVDNANQSRTHSIFESEFLFALNFIHIVYN